MKMVERERRRHPRTPRTVFCWLTLDGEDPGYGTLSIDVSLEGARFGTLRPVKTGDAVLVCLQLRSRTVECTACVCWTRAASNGLLHFGVRFVDLQEADRYFLNRWLHHGPHRAVRAAV